MSMKKLILKLAVATVIIAALVSCGQAQLKVALIGPSQTGDAFEAGVRNGAQMAIDEWNVKGGVLGMKIVPVVEDSREDPATAAAAARKAIDIEHVHYIIGNVFSSPSIAIPRSPTQRRSFRSAPYPPAPA